MDIIIKGAREHNLKNVDLSIPRDKLVVITGLSGSGKSSLAYDTLYAEGQRRYVESLSAYARQFLDQMDKPDVDSIDGLSPAISIEQKTTGRNPRSTVATVTEIYDYFRLLFTRIGIPFCFQCGKPITAQTIQQMADQIMQYCPGEKIQILAPVIRDRKGEYKKELLAIQQKGFSRVRIDGTMLDLSVPGHPLIQDKNKKHTIEVVVDRLVIKENLERRLADSLELAAKMGDGIVAILRESGAGEQSEALFSEHLACIACGVSYPKMEPRIFSFNSPHGACPACHGLGTTLDVDPNKVIPDRQLSLREGTIRPWDKRGSGFHFPILEALCAHFEIDMRMPFCELSDAHQKIILYGSGKEVVQFHYDQDGKRERYHRPFEGVIPNLERRYKETDSNYMKEEIEMYMGVNRCPTCNGDRLKPTSLAIKIGGQSIADLTRLTIGEALRFVTDLPLTRKEEQIARRMMKELRERLGFLVNVGVDYLTLDRPVATLSGGEGQRIRLATQIGSSLVGVLYILDEPSIGLHQRDNVRLLNTLRRLRDLGNTVLVVEHDEETILSADWVIDVGPGAGIHGGEIVAQGTPASLIKNKRSLTGRYLAKTMTVSLPVRQRKGTHFLRLAGVSENNLKQINVEIPIGLFTCVTGVSGSGKSTLVLDVLYKSLAQKLYRSSEKPGAYQSLEGMEYIDKVIHIDQSPIGRTPRSNPATYTGLFTFIRDLFAALPESKMRGYKAGRYSFNVKGGRCEACQGDGLIRIEMHFLPDVYVLCEVCNGKRYNRETLDMHYREKTIADVLAMRVSDAMAFFKAIPVIYNKLTTLDEVGLGYITLGQSATTLSGGEAQRIKLSKELSKRATGRTLYVLDEPTTGLHFADIQRLLEVLNRFAESGNTVVVIEHNLDVIRNADWIIDLGPEGGSKGGEVIAVGTPAEVAKVAASYTGQFLKNRAINKERPCRRSL